jgi:anaerobic ribonucleoside-triphosphate reductase
MLQVTSRFDGFRKRNGLTVPFRPDKIESAISKAAEAASRRTGQPIKEGLAAQVTAAVLEQLDTSLSEYYVQPNAQGRRIPAIEDVQDLVEIALMEQGEKEVATTYKRYRKQRDMARQRIQVRDPNAGGKDVDVTDASLLIVSSASSSLTKSWDRQRIVNALLKETKISQDLATDVAKIVENRVIAGNFTTLSTQLIRAMVNDALAELQLKDQLRDLSLYSIPRSLLESLMFTKSVENSNIVNNNPEAVNLGIAELILKQWALDTIFSPEVKKAHDTGAIHLHDLGYPHRVYCSSHSIEYVKKYGLTGLLNLNTESKPARSASVLTGHLNTFLASMQANYAGALGIAYINIFYAPYLVGMDDKHLRQVAQELIFNGSQNAFSRGGQTLFLDFNIHTGVPKYMQPVPAIGPGGHYMLRLADGSVAELEEVILPEKDPNGNRMMELYLSEAGGRRLVLREIVTQAHGVIYDPEVEKELAARGEKIVVYGDYQEEARRFTRALLQVWKDGDRHGRIFEFPKCDFHVSEDTYTDPAQYAIFMEACELASKNGSTYFIFDRDEVTLSACCRLRTTITDNHMMRHPESMRFCGFQNVTINIPQAAYRAARNGKKTLEGLCEELDKTMDLCIQAHLEKKAKSAIMMGEPGRPLYQIGKESNDGKPYVDLDSCTYIIGLIGLNDALEFITGQELHDCDAAMEDGLRVISHMYLQVRRLAKKHHLKFTLEESPAESAARRLAKTDLEFYNKEAMQVFKGGNTDVAYYTNSIHLTADAPVNLVERIRKQSMFHSLIESGAIIHAFIGEERPSAASIASLITETFHRTQAAQVTLSPEFSYCLDCDANMRGIQEKCTHCGSKNVIGETRVVGYFSKIQNWNKSKRFGELKARQRGDYSVTDAAAQTVGLVTATAVCPDSMSVAAPVIH